MKSIAIILAGGRGARMHSSTPKQYMPVLGEPLVAHTLRTFEHSLIDEVVLVVGSAEEAWVKEQIVDPNGFTKVRYIIEGGVERYDSVYNGLKLIVKNEDNLRETVVLVHDAARACVSEDIINHAIYSAYNNGACVPAVPVKDTIKYSRDGRSVEGTLDREKLWIVQTPQSFVASILWLANRKMFEFKEANPQEFMNMQITDDACIVEHFTEQEIILIEGDYRNIKVTTPEDMILTEAFLSALAAEKK